MSLDDVQEAAQALAAVAMGFHGNLEDGATGTPLPVDPAGRSAASTFGVDPSQSNNDFYVEGRS